MACYWSVEVVYGSCLFKKSLVGSSFLRACSNYISVKLKLFFMAQLKSMIRTQFTSPVAMMDVIASNVKVLAAALGVDFSDLFSVVVFHRAFGDGNEYTVTVGSDKFASVGGRAEALVVRDSAVSYTISSEGFEDITGSLVASGVNEEILLPRFAVASPAPEPVMYTITINPTSSDAEVKLNGVVQSSISVESGSSVSYEVSKDGYTPKSGSVVADSTKTVDVVLEVVPVAKVTITINPTPADATVKLNNVEQKSIEVDKGSQVTYEVSKTDYVTKSATVTASATQTIDVVLDAVSAAESDPEVASLDPDVVDASTHSGSEKK